MSGRPTAIGTTTPPSGTRVVESRKKSLLREELSPLMLSTEEKNQGSGIGLRRYQILNFLFPCISQMLRCGPDSTNIGEDRNYSVIPKPELSPVRI